MLFPAKLHPALADGRVTIAFRRWRRPTVRTGSTLRYAGGVLAIDDVARIATDEVTDADAQAAGAASRDELLADLATDRPGELYRIRFHHLGADPRIALAQADDLDADSVEQIRGELDRLDTRSRRGSWTRATLTLLGERPGVAAAELAAELDVDREMLKRDVRKLKELGLTISRDVGYELSPRGRSFLDTVDGSAGGTA